MSLQGEIDLDRRFLSFVCFIFFCSYLFSLTWCFLKRSQQMPAEYRRQSLLERAGEERVLVREERKKSNKSHMVETYVPVSLISPHFLPNLQLNLQD